MRLEIKDVSCGYSADNPVLRNVSLELRDGDICCILGPNGVGKTTLFKTILGMLPCLSGNMTLDGIDLSTIKDRHRARKIAYVAQTHTPTFPYLVEDIAMMGRVGIVGRFSQPTRHDFEVVEKAINDVGLDYLKGKPYTDISGGERQLLMIAKALAQEPDIIMLDEPTANLDFGNMARVLSKLKQLAADGLCVIFTSHLPDQAFLTQAKTVLLMRNQPLLFGSCDQIVTPSNLKRAYNTRVQVVEIIGGNGRPVRMCAPVLEGENEK